VIAEEMERMPPIAIPPIAALAVLGGIYIGRLVVREFRRINAELDVLKPAREPVDRSSLKTLRRDPRTGEYRPQ
jgi:hypothetical protein